MNLWRKLLPMLTNNFIKVSWNTIQMRGTYITIYIYNNFIKVSWNRGTTWVVVEVVPSG